MSWRPSWNSSSSIFGFLAMVTTPYWFDQRRHAECVPARAVAGVSDCSIRDDV
jgi:hypothetical protein